MNQSVSQWRWELIHRPQNDGGFFDATGDGGGVGGYDIAPWELDPTLVNLGT